MHLGRIKYRLPEFAAREFSVTGKGDLQEEGEDGSYGRLSATDGYYVFIVHKDVPKLNRTSLASAFRNETVGPNAYTLPILALAFTDFNGLTGGRVARRVKRTAEVFLARDQNELIIDGIRSPWAVSYSRRYSRIRAALLVSEIEEFIAAHADAQMTAPKLSKLVRRLDDLVETEENELIDRFLTSMIVRQMQPVFIISVLASTFIIKDKLNERTSFYRKAQQSIREMGHDPEQYLAGLSD